eukprot:766745_1
MIANQVKLHQEDTFYVPEMMVVQKLVSLYPKFKRSHAYKEWSADKLKLGQSEVFSATATYIETSGVTIERTELTTSNLIKWRKNGLRLELWKALESFLIAVTNANFTGLLTSIEEFKCIPIKQHAYRRMFAQKIYEKYLRVGALGGINIPLSVKQHLVSRIDYPEPDYFEEVERLICERMDSEVLPLFMVSDHLKSTEVTEIQSFDDLTQKIQADLKDILQDPHKFVYLSKFMQMEQCAELLIFWKDVEEYSRLPVSGYTSAVARKITTKAKKYASLIRVIGEETLKTIESDLEARSPMLFHTAQENVTLFISRSIVPQFVTSSFCTDLLKTDHLRTSAWGSLASSGIMQQHLVTDFESIEEIITVQPCARMLKLFLEKKKYSHFLLFFLDCSHFMEIPSKQMRISRCQKIWSKYLADDSSLKIDVSSDITDAIHFNMKEAPAFTLREAQQYVLHYMEETFYEEFLVSEDFDMYLALADEQEKLQAVDQEPEGPAIHLREVLGDSGHCHFFAEFLREEGWEHVLFFWLECQNYSDIPSSEFRGHLAQKMYRKFIQGSAMMKVEVLSPDIVLFIHENLDKVEDSLFDSAKSVAFQFLDNQFTLFSYSPLFQNVMKLISETSRQAPVIPEPEKMKTAEELMKDANLSGDFAAYCRAQSDLTFPRSLKVERRDSLEPDISDGEENEVEIKPISLADIKDIGMLDKSAIEFQESRKFDATFAKEKVGLAIPKTEEFEWLLADDAVVLNLKWWSFFRSYLHNSGWGHVVMLWNDLRDFFSQPVSGYTAVLAQKIFNRYVSISSNMDVQFLLNPGMAHRIESRLFMPTPTLFLELQDATLEFLRKQYPKFVQSEESKQLLLSRSKKEATAENYELLVETIREYPDFSSLAELLNINTARMVFHDYLMSSFCSENILFWEDCEEFRKMPSLRLRQTTYRKIVRKYIQPESRLEVNISFPMKRKILEANSGAPNVFDEAQLEVQSLMDQRYREFLGSEQYHSYKANQLYETQQLEKSGTLLTRMKSYGSTIRRFSIFSVHEQHHESNEDLFAKIMENDTHLRTFLDFLEQNGVQNLLLFYHDARDFLATPISQYSSMVASKIYKKYLKPEANLLIPIRIEHIEKIEHELQQSKPQMFSKLLKQVHTALYQQYLKFRHTPEFPAMESAILRDELARYRNQKYSDGSNEKTAGFSSLTEILANRKTHILFKDYLKKRDDESSFLLLLDCKYYREIPSKPLRLKSFRTIVKRYFAPDGGDDCLPVNLNRMYLKSIVLIYRNEARNPSPTIFKKATFMDILGKCQASGFLSYVRRVGHEDRLLLWLDIRSYSTLPESDYSANFAKKTWNKFLKKDAQLRKSIEGLSVPDAMLKDLEENLKNPTAHTFRRLADIVFQALYSLYPDFIQSHEYVEVKREFTPVDDTREGEGSSRVSDITSCLKNVRARMKFKQYLDKNSPSDSRLLLFWVACADFSEIPQQHLKTVTFRKIFRTYIQNGSQNEIPISPITKDVLEERFRSTSSTIPPTALDESQREMERVLGGKTWTSFKKSPFYNDLKPRRRKQSFKHQLMRILSGGGSPNPELNPVISFDDLIKDTSLSPYFHEYLKEETPYINIMFCYEDLRHYEGIPNEEYRRLTAKKLFNKYMRESARMLLPDTFLSSYSCEEIRRKIWGDEPIGSVFRDIMTELYNFQKIQLYPKFVYSISHDAMVERIKKKNRSDDPDSPRSKKK